jgi:hypothetical protein
MDDRDVLDRIGQLVSEEHHLYERTKEGIGLTPADHERLRSIEEALDQCWDLLRQRRARREFGGDPEQAAARDPSVVEGYRQ